MGEGCNKSARRCFPDSEERHERALQRVSAHFDSLVGVVACAGDVKMAGKASCWVGHYLLTGGMEERSPLCGKHCSRWKDWIVARVKRTKERSPHLSGPVVWAWPTRFDFAGKILRLCCAAILNIRGAFSLGVLFWSKWSCLLLRNVLQDALSEAMKVDPLLKMKVQWVISQPSWTDKTGSCQVLRKRLSQ